MLDRDAEALRDGGHQQRRPVVGVAVQVGEGQLVFVTEYMDGGSLQDVIDKGGAGVTHEGVLAKIAWSVLSGLAFLHDAHAQPQGGYAWQLDWDGQTATVQDGTNHCYGLAFVLLAHAHALMAEQAGPAPFGIDAEQSWGWEVRAAAAGGGWRRAAGGDTPRTAAPRAAWRTAARPR